MPLRRYRIAAAIACVALALGSSGCAGAFSQRLVDLRTSQGDAALTAGSLEEAEKEYALALKLDQPKIRREIVLANYPLYETVGASLTDSLKTLAASQHEIALQLKAFRSDFDAAHLTKAIIAAYALQDEEHRLESRIVAYRGLVTSGEVKAQTPAQSETPNLLPVP